MIFRNLQFTLSLILTAAVFLLVAGCGGLDVRLQNMLGMQRGFFIETQDAIVLPGQKAPLKVKLKTGGWMNDEENRKVRFVLDGETYATAITDDEGVAVVDFIPITPGDWVFDVEIDPSGFKEVPPAAQIIVECRGKDAPIAIVDIDGTLVPLGFEKVLTSNPEPLEGAVDVLNRLSGDYTIVYLTHRPDFLGQKSKIWLWSHGFPPGPVLMSEFRKFLRGSERYKAEALGEMKKNFDNITLGIGDKISDIKTYCDNDMQAFMVLHVNKPDDRIAILRQADEIAGLPDGVQVVYDWKELGAAIYEGGTFPPQRAYEKLQGMADAIKPGFWDWLR